MINRINFPLSLLVEHEFHIDNGWIIDKSGKEAINIATGKRITGYREIDAISDSLLYVMDEKNNVGIIDKDNQFVIKPQFYALTYPVGNLFIGVTLKDKGRFAISLYNLTSKNFVGRALNCVLQNHVLQWRICFAIIIC